MSVHARWRRRQSLRWASAIVVVIASVLLGFTAVPATAAPSPLPALPSALPGLHPSAGLPSGHTWDSYTYGSADGLRALPQPPASTRSTAA